MDENPLAAECATFETLRAELCGLHLGRWVLIKGEEVLGVFDRRSHAICYGFQNLGRGPFLTKQILPEDEVIFVPHVEFCIPSDEDGIVIVDTPPTADDEAWARSLVAEGR